MHELYKVRKLFPSKEKKKEMKISIFFLEYEQMKLALRRKILKPVFYSGHDFAWNKRHVTIHYIELNRDLSAQNKLSHATQNLGKSACVLTIIPLL